MRSTVYLGLGSNQPFEGFDPEQVLQRAIQVLRDSGGIDTVTESTWYQTSPVGDVNQPDFTNLVLNITTSLSPHNLLETCLGIERLFGRTRHADNQNAPRTLDIDILFYDDIILNTDTLTLPHPRVHQRLFMLEPLRSIAPELTHPTLHQSIVELTKHVKENSLETLKPVLSKHYLPKSLEIV